MPFQHSFSGAENVAEYMSSGLPFTTASSTTGISKVEFPLVTNWLRVENTAGSNLHVGFTRNGLNGTNYFTVPGGEYRDIPFKVKEIFISSSAGYEVIAGLTHIPRREFYVLTGALVYFSGTQEDRLYKYGQRAYGYDGLG